MEKNADLRMSCFITASLVQQGFNVFTSLINDQITHAIVRNILDDGSPQYIEIQILSRTEEYKNPLQIPITMNENLVFYYFILHSAGMNKIWLIRADELIILREQGLDARDTSPYLVKNFNRLNFPQLSLEEFKVLNS